MKKSSFYEEKSLVGLTPVWIVSQHQFSPINNSDYQTLIKKSWKVCLSRLKWFYIIRTVLPYQNVAMSFYPKIGLKSSLKSRPEMT